ncbi:MAG: hypothetical protein HY000_37005 [Planctomycetes bacterium]|nr:hypothetical protein [Planctomycetota bacterium]
MRNTALSLTVRVHTLRGDLPGALAAIDEAAEEDRCILYVAIAHEQVSRGDLDGVLKTMGRIAGAPNSDHSFERMCRLDLLELAASSKDLSKAQRLRALDELVSTAAAPGDLKGLFRWTQIAAIAAALGDLQRAKSAAHAAQKQIRNSDQPSRFDVRQFLALAAAQTEAGLIAEARESFDRALATVRHMDDDPAYLADVMTEIGQSLLQAGKATEAESAFQAAIDLAAERPDKYNYALLEIVRARLPTRDWQAAVESANKMPRQDYLATALAEIAQAQVDAGDRRLAIETIRRAAEVAADVPKVADEVQTYGKLAQSAELAGDSALADELLQRASQAAQAADAPLHPALFHVIARTQVKTGRLSAAWETIDRIADPQLKSLPLAELALALAKLQAEQE